jgi:CDP-diglyceride synthetase
MSETKVRSITGAVFGLIVIGSVVLSPWTSAALWIAVGVQGWREMHTGTKSTAKTSRWMFAAAVLAWVYLMVQLAWNKQGVYVPAQLMSLLILIWCNDSGAYFVGKPFGKHKLMPAVSPGKSWEGFVGGAFIAGFAAVLLFGWQDVWLGPLMAVLATAGDLLESAWKRSNGIKDSGKIMPGHGGVLDRFDGFTIAAPVYALILYLHPLQFNLNFLFE